jgi:chromatin remodeling complex protein RSC6
MGTMLTAIKAEYRALEKKWVKEIKQAQKAAKKKRKVGNRAPSGFVKAARISDELAAFLGVNKGIEMARTDVTKEITAYVKKHSLQDPENGRDIHPDAKLKKLLQIGANDKLSYFNLQKFMSPHFEKKSDQAAQSA